MREALELSRDGVSSPPETRIRLMIRQAGLPEPVLDYDVFDRYGRFSGCSELAYPELKIAIEYESDGHLTRSQRQRDIDKYQLYAEAGMYSRRRAKPSVASAPHYRPRPARPMCPTRLCGAYRRISRVEA